MIRGQYVVMEDGSRWQLANLSGTTRGYAGLQHLDPPAVYTFVDPLTGTRRSVVWETCRPVNTPAGMATPARFTLTPACEACGVPAGYCYGEGHHHRDAMAAAGRVAS